MEDQNLVRSDSNLGSSTEQQGDSQGRNLEQPSRTNEIEAGRRMEQHGRANQHASSITRHQFDEDDFLMSQSTVTSVRDQPASRRDYYLVNE